MIEEHVVKLAELQAERKVEEEAADTVSANIDEIIKSTKQDLVDLEDTRRQLRNPQDISISDIDLKMDLVKDAIIDEWSGEKKTMVFDAGTLKFRKAGSLKIIDKTLVLTGLLDHTSVKDVAMNYITGFNLTATRKYMGVLELPMGAAEIEYKTTVKLEQKSG